jgi:hypothetical protein
MISLSPPYLDVGGVTLLPDHDDPLRWYYLNLRPRVSVGAAGKPQLCLTKYRTASGGGGLLDFGVDLGLTPAERDVITTKLADYVRGRGGPRDRDGKPVKGTLAIVAAPAVSGTAHVMMFGDTSRPKTASATAPTSFVTAFAYPTSPALFGDNRAIFSIALDPNGARLVELTLGAAPGELTPIGVLYELELEGLRPAYRVSIDARWDEVHHRLSKRFAGQLLWFGGEIEATVDELLQTQAIRIDVHDYGSAPTEKAAKEAAVAQVRTHIFNTFFKPAPVPAAPPEKTAWEHAGNLIDSTARAVSTFGLSTWGSFTWSNIDVEQVHERAFAVEINERTTVRQKVYPCAQLGDLAASIADRAALVRPIRLADDPFFKTRELTFAVDVDLAAEHIANVVVEATYGDDTRTVALAPNDKGLTTQAAVPNGWPTRAERGAIEREVDVRYTVYFQRGAGADAAHLPPQLPAPRAAVEGDHHTLAVSELYTVQTVHFEADLGFPWDNYKSVEVYCRPDDRDAARADDVVVLRAGERLKPWKVFRTDPTRSGYAYRLVLTPKKGERILVPRPAADASAPAFHVASLPFISIDDPRPETRSIMLTPRVDWTLYDAVDVTLFGDGQRRDRTISFHAEDKAPRKIDLSRATDAGDELDYAVAFYRVGEDTPVRLPRATTSSSRLTITPAMTGTRRIAVRTAADGFDRARLVGVDVQLAGTTLGFGRGGEQQHADVPVAVGTGPAALRWTAVYRYAGGLTYEADPRDVLDTAATIEIPLLPFPA